VAFTIYIFYLLRTAGVN